LSHDAPYRSYGYGYHEALSTLWSFREGQVRPFFAQRLPAFSNCSLDHSPGDGDHDDAEKGGGINLYQLWEPETIVDEPDHWEITLNLRDDCPRASCITDLTPRRCQKFHAKPGERFRWTHTTLTDDRPIQSGTAAADKWGLVTVEKLTLDRAKTRVNIFP